MRVEAESPEVMRDSIIVLYEGKLEAAQNKLEELSKGMGPNTRSINKLKGKIELLEALIGELRGMQIV